MKETNKHLKENLPGLLQEGYSVKQIAELYSMDKSNVYKTIKKLEREMGIPEGSLLPHSELSIKGNRNGSGPVEPRKHISKEEINFMITTCDNEISEMENIVEIISKITTATATTSTDLKED